VIAQVIRPVGRRGSSPGEDLYLLRGFRLFATMTTYPTPSVTPAPMLIDEINHEGFDEAVSFEVEDNRRFNFTMIDNCVIRALPQLGLHAFAVYCILGQMAGEKGRSWPSIRLLSERCSLKSTSIREALRILKDHGLIRVNPRRDATGRQTSNVYILLNTEGYAPALPSAPAMGGTLRPGDGGPSAPANPLKNIQYEEYPDTKNTQRGRGNSPPSQGQEDRGQTGSKPEADTSRPEAPHTPIVPSPPDPALEVTRARNLLLGSDEVANILFKWNIHGTVQGGPMGELAEIIDRAILAGVAVTGSDFTAAHAKAHRACTEKAGGRTSPRWFTVAFGQVLAERVSIPIAAPPKPPPVVVPPIHTAPLATLEEKRAFAAKLRAEIAEKAGAQ